MDAFDASKQQQREIWSLGDYATIARKLVPAAEDLVARIGIRAGQRVLDVACGTGTATLPAAAAGATTVGLDLTPSMFGPARTAAEQAGLSIEWIEGDAEALPFGAESFDVVLSTFGCMFAPRHERVADEMLRVLAPNGRFGLCCWSPSGFVGDFFALIAGHLPPRPAELPSPLAWGEEESVRELFARRGVELAVERRQVEFDFDSLDSAVATYLDSFGPLVAARGLLEPEGRFGALRDGVAALFATGRQPDGRVALRGDYLAIVGRR